MSRSMMPALPNLRLLLSPSIIELVRELEEYLKSRAMLPVPCTSVAEGGPLLED